MYNFFSSKLKRKAFIKALAEVEESGIYADYTADRNAAIYMPDVEAQIAELSKKQKQQQVADDTLDITALSGSEISQASEAELNRGKDSKQFGQAGQQDSQTTGEDTLSYYDRLFNRRSFLSGEKDYTDVQFLQEGNPDDEQNSLHQELPIAMEPTSEAEEEKPKTRITTRILDQMAREKQARQAEELKKREDQLAKDRQEFSRLQQEELLRRAEQDRLIEEREQEARLAAERAEEARLAALAAAEKARADAAAAAAAVTVKPVRKTTNSGAKRKRRRRYDADIIGDYDF